MLKVILILIAYQIALLKQNSCPQDFLQDFGIQSKTESSNDSVWLCSLDDNTCCNINSNTGVYGNWIINGEGVYLEQKLKASKKLYEQVLLAIQKINYKKDIIAKNWANSSQNNCSIMSELIAGFNFNEIIPFLQTQTDSYFNFIQQSYQGFYCSLCTAQATTSIDRTKNQLLVSQGFSSNFIKSGISFYSYFNYHIPKALELLLYFNKSCDFEGNYNAQNKIQSPIKIKKEIWKKIFQCINSFENKEQDWYCSWLTENFSIFKVKDEYLPKQTLFMKFVKEIHESLTPELINQNSKTEQKYLYSHLNSVELRQLELDLNIYQTRSIINQQIFSRTKATSFKLAVSTQQDQGFDFQSQSHYMKITEPLYNEILTQINKKIQSQENQQAQNYAKQSFSSGVSGLFSSIFGQSQKLKPLSASK